MRAMDLAESIYQLTRRFPKEEMYGLTSQLRRSVTSIALNIAEGSGASSDVEFNRFLDIALRSSYETMCGIELANRLNYCSNTEKDTLLADCDKVSALIYCFKKRLKSATKQAVSR